MNSVINKENIIIWVFERPDGHSPVAMSSQCFLTWPVLLEERVIGPSIFENEYVSGKSY